MSIQREAYKKALANARYMQREAVAIYGKEALASIKIPTMRDIDKMKNADKISAMKVVRSIKSPADFKSDYAAGVSKVEYIAVRESAKTIEKVAKATYREKSASVYAPTITDLSRKTSHDRRLIIDALKMLNTPEELERKQTKAGAKISDYERSVMMRDHALVEARKADELAKVPQEQRYYMYASDYEVSLRPETLNIDTLSEQALRKKKERLSYKATDEYIKGKRELYHRNYLKSIDSVYGTMADKAKINALLNKIPISEWNMLFDIYEYLTMDFRYDDNISLSTRYDLFMSDLEMVASKYT